MLRHHTHNTVPSRTTMILMSPLFSISYFSTPRSYSSVASRHARQASAVLIPTHANAVWHCPFQPTACICIFLCTNSIVLQALQERYNARRCMLAALCLLCPCLCVNPSNSKLYSLVNHIYTIVRYPIVNLLYLGVTVMVCKCLCMSKYTASK